MTSFRQIQANRQNAQRSTGPTSAEGKERSRRNAVRHGLTAETVIHQLEDAEDYQAFEAAIIADYDAQTAVERELVLRLASILWRLRRATALETGLFEIQAEGLQSFDQTPVARPRAPEAGRETRLVIDSSRSSNTVTQLTPTPDATSQMERDQKHDLTNCFLALAELPNYALDRLSRYEAILWRQAWQLMYALDNSGRRKRQERSRFAFFGTRAPRQMQED